MKKPKGVTTALTKSGEFIENIPVINWLNDNFELGCDESNIHDIGTHIVNYCMINDKWYVVR